MKRLGVNIDHVATLRNARNEFHPDPVYAAKFVNQNGADSVTIHLREDRRHIKDLDAKRICSIKKILVNLEVSTNPKIIKKALQIKPNFICIVPENRREKKKLGQAYLLIQNLVILRFQTSWKQIVLNYILVS